MLGKGLESLIPDKRQQQNNAGDSNGNPPRDESEERYDGEAVSRVEREGLGILSGLSSAPVSEVQIIVEPPHPQRDPVSIPSISGPIFHVETERITVNPYQPRKVFDENALQELATSIREFGIIQPLVVVKVEEETETGLQSKYQLIAGHRRLFAARKAGLRTVPVVVRNAGKKTEMLEIAILENIQREDLNVIETARAYARLSDEFGLTQREIAARLGKSREAIANALRLLSLSSEIQESLSKGEIQESHARILMQVPDIQSQKDLHKKIMRENLSVRDVKRAMTQRAASSQQHPRAPKDVQLQNVEKELSEFLGAPVRVEVSKNGGKIIIHFYSAEEAIGIAQKIHPDEM